MCMFFFFKQKTAYEMRISDWSSDVCSSDLRHPALNVDRARRLVEQGDIVGLPAHAWRQVAQGYWPRSGARAFQCHRQGRAGAEVLGDLVEDRSEEHTSELQSLMRISYAVFCLKKKKKKKRIKQKINKHIEAKKRVQQDIRQKTPK